MGRGGINPWDGWPTKNLLSCWVPELDQLCMGREPEGSGKLCWWVWKSQHTEQVAPKTNLQTGNVSAGGSATTVQLCYVLNGGWSCSSLTSVIELWVCYEGSSQVRTEFYPCQTLFGRNLELLSFSGNTPFIKVIFRKKLYHYIGPVNCHAGFLKRHVG